MIKDLLFMQSYGYFEGGAIGNMLNYWEQAGFFSYLIPFLLIFSIVFGILTQIRLFKESKAINAIIALSVGLMALQFPFVSMFFSEIFPRVAIGLIILLLIIIFTGLFSDPKSKIMMYTMYGVGAITILIILVQTAGVIGWYSFMPWLGYNWPIVLGGIAFIVIIAVIIGSARERGGKDAESVWANLLKGAAKAAE